MAEKEKAEYNPIDFSDFIFHTDDEKRKFQEESFEQSDFEKYTDLTYDYIKDFTGRSGEDQLNILKSLIQGNEYTPKTAYQIRRIQDNYDFSFEDRNAREVSLTENNYSIDGNQKNVHTPTSFSIASLLSKMPMFSENLFTAYFINGNYENLYSLADKKFVNRDAFKYAINGFGVRISDFEVPQPKNETYSIKFLDREIKKIASNYDYQHKVNLNFEVDQMAMTVQNFQILSYGNQGNNYKLDLSPQEENKYYAEQFFPAAFGNRKSNLKLIVLFNEMNDNSYFKPAQKRLDDKKENYINSRNQIIGNTSSFRAFIFENVQFLGISSAIEFNRDDAEVIKVPVTFRFKDIIEFDRN